ncbi:MAG: VCBS repeat-containing protein, partial [Myxococcota bacterium]|nr:VCBS repeat-containing protein [Myxococcota bacterium]
ATGGVTTGGTAATGGMPTTGGQAPTGGSPVVSPSAGFGGMVSAGGAAAGGSGGAGAGLSSCDAALTTVLAGPLANEAGGGVVASVSRDFNGDGRLDLAGANLDGSLSLLLGNGDGTFAAGVVYPTGLEDGQRSGFSPSVIVASDFDWNGTADLALVSPASTSVSVLLGRPDGTFGPATEYSLPGVNIALTSGDFDGDGSVDLAVVGLVANAGIDVGSLHVLSGKRDGTFVVAGQPWEGGAVEDIEAADVDADGVLDLVVLDDTSITVLYNQGGGKFGAPRVFSAADDFTSLEASDFDSDGYTDVAVAFACGASAVPESGVQLFQGDGMGGLVAGSRYLLADGCAGPLQLADVNGDALLDLIAAPWSPFLARGDGSFLSEVSSPALFGQTLVGLADWNGDGDRDVMTSAGTSVVVYPGRGEGSFGYSRLFETGIVPASLVVGNFGASAAPDVATVNLDSSRQSSVSLLFNEGDGTLASPVQYPTEAPAGALRTADLNADGWPDLLLPLASSAGIGVLLGSSSGELSPMVSYEAGLDPRELDVGDLNRDGALDVVVADQIGQAIQVLLGKGDGSFEAPSRVQLGRDTTQIAVLDANRDAFPDVAVTSLGALSWTLLLGDGTGAFHEAFEYAGGERASQLTHGDLDHDGNEDVLISNQLGLSIFFGTSQGNFERTLGHAGLGGDFSVVDMDLDGISDLVSTSFGDPSGVTIAFGNGDGTFRCKQRYAIGLSVRSHAVGDLNRDGRNDLAVVSGDGVEVWSSRPR